MAEQPFHGQVALITGSSRGIGRATALLLARRGADIAVHYRRDEAAAQAACSGARAAGLRAVALRCDLRDQEAVAGLVQQVGASFGRLDLLVANAASTAFKPLLELAPHNIGLRRAMAVDLGRDGITCNLTSVGLTLTERMLDAGYQALAERFVATTPMARTQRPDDVPGTVAYFAS